MFEIFLFFCFITKRCFNFVFSNHKVFIYKKTNHAWKQMLRRLPETVAIQSSIEQNKSSAVSSAILANSIIQ